MSKWETGQSEPTAKKLTELAALFGMNLSELVEPEKTGDKRTFESKNTKERIVCAAVGAYTGALILSTVKTDIPSFFTFVFVITLLPAIVMAIMIWYEKPQIRSRRAIWELVYCTIAVLASGFLPFVVGNIITALMLCVLCALYIKFIRFR